MHKTNPETHQACRSLLQKAVRRGDIALTDKVARHLHDIGDTNWLKSRAFVILFEECWPLASELEVSRSSLRNVETVYEVFNMTARAVKNKDAAGLGSLAYEYSRGDYSVFIGDSADQHIKHVNEAIKRPNDFWEWTFNQCFQNDQLALVKVAHKAYRRGGWPWDRAFMLAAAYLAIKSDSIHASSTDLRQEVPFWTGLDKHTSQGKGAIRETANIIGVPARQLSWISFYFESALLNVSIDSYWWSREIRWRLKKFGIDYETAQSTWLRARPVIIEVLKEQSEHFREHLSKANINEASSVDLSCASTQPSFENFSRECTPHQASPTQQSFLPGF